MSSPPLRGGVAPGLARATRRVVARAAVQPLNLGVAASSVVLGFGFSSWAIGALGGLAYLALVAFDTSNPKLWREGETPAPLLPSLPTFGELEDPLARRVVSELGQSRAELQQLVKSTPSTVQAEIAAALSGVRALDQQTVKLLQRSEELSRHLRTFEEPALRAEIASLEQRLARTVDERAGESYREALRLRRDELRARGEITRAKDRVDAQLLKVVALLAGLPTKMVHLQALDAEARDSLSGDLQAELAAVMAEMQTSEEIVKALGDVTT